MEPFTLIIVGLTSNLAQIKLIPTLYDLIRQKALGPDFRIVGLGRTPLDRSGLAALLDRSLHTPSRYHAHPIDAGVQAELLSHLHYLALDLTDSASYPRLTQELKNSPPNRLFYLATFPSLYAPILRHLHNAHLLQASPSPWTRLMLEKPLGTDQDSSRELNNLLTAHLSEDQIFRLDHYLGKETLQNILTFRFGNGLLEPLMSAEHIDHIQVTASEDFGVGNRGEYYDTSGALRDVGQNHLLQMLALTTMDAPASYSAANIMARRLAAIQALVPDPTSLVVGQYDGYLHEPHISPLSTKETFFAFKTTLSATRLAGVPIYARAGKKLARTAAEITFVFKNPSSRLHTSLPGGNSPNLLIYRLQPNEGIVLKILTKVPGHELKVEESYMQFCYPTPASLPDAYERLIMDALHGDQTFFNDAVEVDAQWAFADSLIGSINHPPLSYAPGTWGPAEVDATITRDGRAWLEPSTAFCPL